MSLLLRFLQSKEMNTFWTTLIEINLILSIVYLGYILFLRNLTFFRWTRIYLLGGMLTGLIYPFLKTQELVGTPAESVNILIPNISQISQTQNIDYGQWAVYAISAVFLLLSLRFLIRFFSLGKIHFASDNAEFHGQEFRNTNKQINPFSFWKWIYIHRDSHSDFEMKQIVTHEHIHTRERHTFDVLVAEVCTIVCWYNPVIKHLSKAVKDNLEFLVDAEVLYSGIDKVSYQHSLVGISLSGFPQPRHGNQFAFKTLKRRIKMMNKKQSSRYRLFSLLILTPIILGAASLLTFSCQKETLDVIKKAERGESISLTGKGKIEELNLSENPVKENLTLTTEVAKVEFERTVTAEVNPSTGESEITNVKLDLLENETTKFSFEASSVEFNENTMKLNPPIKLRGNYFGSNTPLFILDGKEILHIENIKPDEIESISVLKDKSATALYGDKAKNGVILIVTKLGSRR